MIKKILFPITLIFAVAAGGISADFLKRQKNAPKQSPQKADHKPGNSHKKPDKKTGHQTKKSKAKKSAHGKSETGQDANTPNSYLKFKRQFVVPVMNDGNIDSLVLLNLTLELNHAAPANAYTLEPKLRNAIMHTLLTLSHDGVFSHDLTSADTYDSLRAGLLEAAQNVITDGVENVLILDLARQDQ